MKKQAVAVLARKLGEARMRLLRNQPFFAILLLHTPFCLDDTCRTAATDGRRIVFAPAFLDSLSPLETEFVLLHEIMHVALGHCFRQRGRECRRFNIACDIVVNDTIRDEAGYELPDFNGESPYSGAPDGRSGSQCSAEEVYAMLRPGGRQRQGGLVDSHELWGAGAASGGAGARPGMDGQWDHWQKLMLRAAASVASRGAGNLPMLAQRMLARLRQPQIDWRRTLRNFMKHEIFDYSFERPDPRYGPDSPMLPQWGETRQELQLLVWIAIDASGSMSDAQVAEVESEVRAITKICGERCLLSFFDVSVTEPVSCREEDIARLRPMGGGGTDFGCVFARLAEMRPRPKLLIIMTDGEAPFPPQAAARGAAVLWLLNNARCQAPWGSVARLPEHNE